jgi:hypothetical protein
MLRIRHCLENWLTDGSEVVSLARRPHSASLVFISVKRPSKQQGLVRPEGVAKFVKVAPFIKILNRLTEIGDVLYTWSVLTCEVPTAEVLPSAIYRRAVRWKRYSEQTQGHQAGIVARAYFIIRRNYSPIRTWNAGQTAQSVKWRRIRNRYVGGPSVTALYALDGVRHAVLTMRMCVRNTLQTSERSFSL